MKKIKDERGDGKKITLSSYWLMVNSAAFAVELAKRQQKGFGGMVAFETGSLENAKKVLENVKICTLAESLGGVESLISHPATMTHASVPAEKRGKLGITDGLVRVSVGIEDIEDILEDLDQALS